MSLHGQCSCRCLHVNATTRTGLFVRNEFIRPLYERFASREALLHELAMRLATPHGVYVEHRRVMNLYNWHGPYERHYVYRYLFPTVALGQNSAPDANDTRSTESIRNRQALSE
jgi:hypothetical protein